MGKGILGKKFVCFQPESVSRFQCNGSLCEAKCCKGWGVDIDDRTRKKYRNMKVKEVGKEIFSHMEQREGGCFIKHRPDGRCPFLLEDFRCRLQKEYGESYLSAVCRTYPRAIYVIGDFMERSLDLSCPVAANLVLLERNPMAFEEVEFFVENPIHVIGEFPAEKRELLLKLQYGSISILQDRRFTIDQRLVILGFFMEQAQEMGEDMTVLEALVQVYLSEELLGQTAAMFQAIRFQPENFLKKMFGLIEALYGESSSVQGQALWLESVTRVFGLGEAKGEASLKDLVEVYKEKYPGSKATLMKEYGYIFENYLVNEFFMRLYPFHGKGAYIQNLASFYLEYKLLEFFMVAMELCMKSLMCEEMLAFAVENLCFKFDHVPAYQECVMEEAMKAKDGIGNFLKSLMQV